MAVATSASSFAAWPRMLVSQASRIAGFVSYTSCTIVPTRQVNSGSLPVSIASVRFDRNDGTHPIYRDGSRADCFSSPLRRVGAGEIADAERGQRVCDGVGDGGEGGDGAGLAAAFDAERVGRAAGAVEPRANEGRLPAIAELTDRLTAMDDPAWQRAVARLRA
jgi:hypothetical protein